jgi:hypothetical protein
VSARSHLARSLRVAAWVGVVAVGLGALGAKKVHAKSTRAAMALAGPLEHVGIEAGGGTTLSINGQRLGVAAARVDLPVRAVLDRVQKGCETHADGLADDLGEIEESMTREPSPRGFPGIGMLRDEREGRGVVACFAPGETTDELGLVRRARRFAESHDLGDLGGMRYVAAHVDEDGKTKVVATWSDGHLDLDALFPANGADAPGADPQIAPRPDRASRVLSATVAPAPYGVFVYGVPGDAASAEGAYARVLAARGFERVALDADGGIYRRGFTDVLVSTDEGPEGTTIAVVESTHAQAQEQP